MKFGAQVNSFDATWDDIHPYIQTMEAGRWNSLWFADHFLPPGARREDENGAAFDGFTLIAVAAGMTQRLKLGGLVMGNTYRNPALVAKMATTLDQASKGRFILGLGAAWFKREHEAYGWDFPSMKERSDRLQEACELIRKLFTADGPVDYNGRYYRLDQAPLSPGCYQKASHSDYGRRHRRAPHIAHPGHARRHFQFQRLDGRHVYGKLSAQARRVGAALRKRRSRSCGDQEHDAHAIEPHGRQGIR